MPQETAYLRQRAVLWPTGGFDSFGQPTVGSPEEICCRWNNVERQARDSKGNPVAITAEVVVKQAVEVGSILWLGTLASYYGVGSAGTNVGLMEVVSYSKTPDIKNRAQYRQLSLAQYRNTLPETN